jgi:hypothetical protein
MMQRRLTDEKAPKEETSTNVERVELVGSSAEGTL